MSYLVYFAFEDEDLEKVLDDIKRNDAVGQPAITTTGELIQAYCLITSSQETFIIHNYEYPGWLPGSKVDGDSNQLPTIAILASYDTFGAALALSVGSDSNGSGVMALIEIARLFYILYSNPNTRGRYNILFGLTSGGPYTYNKTQKWLRSFDQCMRESIDYAICLNSLGLRENELWLHVSKPPENAYVKQIFEVNSHNLCHFDRLDKSYDLGNHFDFCVTFCLCIKEFVNEASVVKSVKVVAKSVAELADHVVEVASITFDLLLLLGLGS
ncbi:EF-hand 1, calcium-binding site-containing protein [Tanacetum coccineum]